MDEYAVIENEGAVGVCVDSGVTEGFEADLTVSLSATDGTACEYEYMHQLHCTYLLSLQLWWMTLVFPVLILL